MALDPTQPAVNTGTQPVEAFPPPQTPMNTRSEDFASGQMEGEIVPSKWDAFVTKLKESSASAPVGFMTDEPGALIRMSVQNQTEQENQSRGINKIKPEEANKRYPGMPVPFTEPVDPYVAELQYNDFKHREYLSNWAGRAAGMPRGTDFAAGVIGGFADPLYMGLGLATGGAATALGVKQTVRNVFLQNLGINVAAGIPTFIQEQRERQDVTLGGAAQQAVEGAVGGTIFHYAAQGLAHALKMGIDWARGTPIDVQEQTFKRVVAQHEQGAKVDAKTGVFEDQMRRSGQMADGTNPHVYATEQLPENTHYVGMRADGTFVTTNPNLGPGIQTSDHGQMINNMASDGKGGGMVGRLKMPEDLKLFDLEQPAVAEHGAENSLLKAIEEKTGIKLEPKEGESVKDVLDRMHSQVTDPNAWHEMMGEVNKLAESQGFKGYEFTGRDAAGNPTDDRTHLFLADNRLTGNSPEGLEAPLLADQRVAPDAQFQANEQTIPTISDEEKHLSYQAETQARQASRDYTPELEKEVHDLMTGKPVGSDPADLDPLIEEQSKAAQAKLQELAADDPHLKEELEQIKREQATDKQEQGVFQTLADCVMESMV